MLLSWERPHGPLHPPAFEKLSKFLYFCVTATTELYKSNDKPERIVDQPFILLRGLEGQS